MDDIDFQSKLLTHLSNKMEWSIFKPTISIEDEIKKKIESFPENSIIRNLFWCEILSMPDINIFRFATITKEGAELLNTAENKIDPSMCGIKFWSVPMKVNPKHSLEENLFDLETLLEEHFLENNLKCGIPPKILESWR